MNQNLLSSPWINGLFIIILAFFLLSMDFVGAVDPYYQNCRVPRTCGDNQTMTISFPFYIPDQQNSHCGYPGFELSCNDKKIPILNLSNDSYIVRQISYENQSFIVSNTALSLDDLRPAGSCIPPLRNLSLPNDRFQLPKQSQAFLIYDCHAPTVLPEYQIGCYSQNVTNWVLGVPENDLDQLANLSTKCGKNSSVVPVKDYSTTESVGIREALSRGFELKWRADDCNRCKASGGVCGFNTSAYLFRCYCPDRPHHVRCISATTVAAGGALTVILICCIRKFKYNKPLCFWKKQNQTDQNIEAFLRNYGPVQVRRYSYSDVKKMTNSFKEKLGQGGYGGVYKGILHDNSLVAVKVLNDSKGNGEEFINEVASISRTSHVNIVSLLGFCFEGRKRALIYQFMPNGSLEKFIFNSNHSLAWDTLFQISLGIARGLEYLHRGCNTRILHFDIKPHNILLDEHLSPKISDFGLARVCTRRESIISMLDARGTIGYIAPEVFCRGFGGVSHKSDVYSYGMLVLEMVGGRKNVNVGVDDTSEIYFPHWIYKRLELDEELRLKRIMNEVEKIEVKKMIIVGLWCTQIDSSNRPAMSRVIEMLEGSLDSLQLPPKPILSSPSYSNFPPDSSSMIV
ncbi:LEAF RUST 10 DISEASE-RESISTANCE LOCUS RECEPTOR-LIKE PROTEIN KINASE-like 2.1 isoform X2 [Ziziphus jujuba]|uniref:non-specific serine/threonine protein kinase n=1 Tax=Ziziphus jujuba TaxID=326968 RepID=A0ABM3ZXI8_ZIZJJ|nr:LEAF RUST 10 DISEASE-RESISTANCE LOCUS RECEPTOR-LIKE PROTEIN KINASE-like 2.1 isoform X2 [Ziziphus jujuba]